MYSTTSPTIEQQWANTQQLIAELMCCLALHRVTEQRVLYVLPNNKILANNIQHISEQLVSQDTIIQSFNCTSFGLLADLCLQKQIFNSIIADYSGVYIRDKRQKNLEHFFGIKFLDVLPPHLICFLYNIMLLSPNAYLAALMPNTWLNTAVGQQVQHLLLDRFEVVALISTNAEQWHDTQNAVHILVIKEQTNEVLRNQHLTKFVYCTQPLHQFLNSIDIPNWVQQIIRCKKHTQTPPYKITCVSQFMLRLSSYRWIQYLTAANIYWDLLKQGRGKFKTLEHIAQIHEGIATGCDHFFLLHDITNSLLLEEQGLLLSGSLLATIKNAPANATTIKALVANNLRVVQNRWNEKWLIEATCLQTFVSTTSLNNTPTFLLAIDTDLYLPAAQKRYPYTTKYVQWGEQKNIATRPIVKQRNPWYQIPLPPTPNLYTTKHLDGYAPIYQTNYFVDNNNVGISLHDPKQAHLIAQYGQSTIGILMQQTLLRYHTNNKPAQLSAALLADYQVPQQLPNTPPFLQPFSDTNDWINGKIALDEAAIDLASIDPKRLAYDTEVLSLLGVINPKERRQLLTNLYATTIGFINNNNNNNKLTQTHLTNPKSSTDILTHYLNQLNLQLSKQQIIPQKNAQFVQYLQILIANMTQKPSKQHRLLSAYWRATFGKRYNARQMKIENNNQTDLF